ncbi:sterile alpha motif domain-containing protein 12-like [Ciona intestinalis]
MSLPQPYHQRHHSVGNQTKRRTASQGGTLDVGETSSGRRRPGSESDVLESRGADVTLRHQDSLMLAYHHRPSVVVSHNTALAGLNAPIRQTKPVHVWTQTEVCKWLKRHLPENQAHYTELFAYHDITGKTLLGLNETKLTRMGVCDTGHRNNILHEILKLQMKDYMQCFKGLQTAGMFDIQ